MKEFLLIKILRTQLFVLTGIMHRCPASAIPLFLSKMPTLMRSSQGLFGSAIRLNAIGLFLLAQLHHHLHPASVKLLTMILSLSIHHMMEMVLRLALAIIQ